ncbi:MAG: hypothetical protein KKA73_18915 [Chloroflexi bacterium]|nr:hypothetical protein [Chloroflexota bacterium]MBU1749761.1 hypothetical protein [Chloroflexota bacterium]MBU1879275.1 hypothetical protein [Chloroflexota bacterium]
MTDLKKTRSATRVVASTIGVLVGLFGMEHGFFEILQGNTVPGGLIIDAIGPAHEFWPGAMEPALTIVPNFLVTGILAVTVGLLTVIWSVAFIDHKYGAWGLLLLCIVLLLVGGGSPPLIAGTVACLVATRIGKPLTWWRTHLSDRVRGVLVRSWPWSLIAYVLSTLAGVAMAILGYPLAWFFSLDVMAIILYAVGNLSLVFLAVAVLSGFAYDIQKRIDSET